MVQEILVTFTAGSDIDDACREAIRLAKLTNHEIQFSFNGVKMHIQPDSILEQELEKFDVEIKIC